MIAHLYRSTRLALCLALILPVAVSSCRPSVSRLQQRAEELAALLGSIPTGDRNRDIESIVSFMIPSAATTTRAAEMYSGFVSSESRIVAWSVDGVRPDTSAVTLRAVIREGGKDIALTQITHWGYIDGEWYCTFEPAIIARVAE